jgi:hypothetical protein
VLEFGKLAPTQSNPVLCCVVPNMAIYLRLTGGSNATSPSINNVAIKITIELVIDHY